MIIKTLLLVDDKLVNTNLSVNINGNKIIINPINNIDTIIKIPVYNKYNGIDYYPILFPFEMTIYNNLIYNPYIILSSFNFNDENEIDFFYILKENIKKEYNLEFIKFYELIEKSELFDEIIKDIKLNIITININEFINSLWYNINMIKLYVLYVNIKYPQLSNKMIKQSLIKINIHKKLLLLCNQIKMLPYKLFMDNDYLKTFIEYYNYEYNKSLELSELKIDKNYYIVINKKELVLNNEKITNKIIKVNILNINGNIIQINEFKNIIFDNYIWYEYYPNIKINKDYVIYQTFINNNYMNEIIKKLFIIDNNHSNKIINYYINDKKKSNLIIFSTIYDTLKDELNDFNILKSNSYSDGFFEYITKKYSDTHSSEILEILFNNYNYPLKSNRHDMNKQFDYLLYFSIKNYKKILLKNNANTYSNDVLEINVNSMIPMKLKNLYINILKLFSQLLDNNFELIIYNQKFYNDYLHKSIIKLFVSNNDNLSINLFKSMINPQSFNKFKHIIFTNLLLIDIIEKLNWNNISKKLNYIDFFYKNTDIIYYKDKLNKNILPDNFDTRIKKIIENPFEMYKFLKKDTDFIKWTKFISDKMNNLYYVPISLSSDDFSYIGKLVYLLINITEQNLENSSYNEFINFCNQHNNLILDGNRINLKIKENFQFLKTNINLGFLAKHLTCNNDIISLDEQKPQKSNEILLLESKLTLCNNKYYKYKNKYLRTKNMNYNTIYDSETSDN